MPAAPAPGRAESRLGGFEHYNWYGGAAHGARSGATFARPGGNCVPASLWPRSSAADVDAALGALEDADARGRPGPRRSDHGARAAVLRRACRRLEERPDLAPGLALDLGLREAEARERLEAELFRLREAVELLVDGGGVPARGGVTLFAAHCTDGLGDLGARLAAHWIHGAPVLLVASAVLPRAAAAVVDALLAAGADSSLALLHDTAGEALRAALADERVSRARLVGEREVLERAARHAHDGLRLDARRHWARTRVVGARDDLEQAALEVGRHAFGRCATLSGQLPGRVGRVICHERVHSRFSEALLAVLEAAADDPAGARDPLAWIERDAHRHALAVFQRGLAEGAAPIHGAAPGDPASPALEPLPSGGSELGAGVGNPLATRGHRLRYAWPLVFTNVEPLQELALVQRAMPLLCLLRAASDDEARELAALHDRPTPRIGSAGGASSRS